MKYDESIMIESNFRPNDNIVKDVKKKKKVNIVDLFWVQAAVCVLASIGVMVYRIVSLAMWK